MVKLTKRQRDLAYHVVQQETMTARESGVVYNKSGDWEEADDASLEVYMQELHALMDLFKV